MGCKKKYVIHNTLHFYFTLFFLFTTQIIWQNCRQYSFWVYSESYTQLYSDTEAQTRTRRHVNRFFLLLQYAIGCTARRWQTSLKIIIAINLPNSFRWKSISKIERIPNIQNTTFWFLCKSDRQRTTIAAFFFFFFLIHFPRPFSIRLFSCLNGMAVCGCVRGEWQLPPYSSMHECWFRTFHSFHHPSKRPRIIQTDRSTLSTNDVNFFHYRNLICEWRIIRI